MSSVSDLCRQLGIRHPLEQSTCIGYGQKKPTCGCAVAESSRLLAVAKLENVKDSINSGIRVSNEVLQSIAGLLLCKRWHQFQADENAQYWRRNLRETLATPSRAPLPTASRVVTPAPNFPAPRPAPISQPNIESFSDQQLLDEIKRRLRYAQNDGFLRGVVEVANTALENRNSIRAQRQGNTSVANPRPSVDEAPRPSHSSIPSTTPPPFTSTTDHANRTDLSQSSRGRSATINTAIPDTQAPISRPAPASESVRQARITALTPVPTSPRPEPPARAPSPLRQSHLECVVCSMSYEEDPEHWECQRCLNRVHMQCFETWRAQHPTRVTCIHCRTRISQTVVA